MFHRLFLSLIALTTLLFAAQNTKAEIPHINGTIAVSGNAIQGGLITAKIPAGAKAYHDDKPLMVSAQNHIAFGFHRDDISDVIIEIETENGLIFETAITPLKRRYKTQSITGLPGKYVSPPDEVLARIKRDRIAVTNARARKSRNDDFIVHGFDWPSVGIITGVYGAQRILNGTPRAPHYGIDIAAPSGTSVTSPADGIITMAESLYYTGGTIIIDHGLGISSTMLHLETMAVSLGDKVTRGMVIGTVGSTGRSTGPHLDWRLNWFDKRLDAARAANQPVPPKN